MKKTLLLASLCLAASTATMAQVVQKEPKLNGSLTVLMKQFRAEKDAPATRATKRVLNVGAKEYNVAENIKVLIDCEDAATIAEKLKADGFQATAVTNNTVTASISLELVDTLVTNPLVKRIELSRRFQKRMKNARAMTGVDKVHEGTGFETPFTGKDVVLGVIDQGFQYKHVAFLTADGTKSRVIAGWNHRGGAVTPWKTTPSTGEKEDSHATHVTAIAAGTDVNGYGGVAPDADIVMVPSTFSNDDIIEEVKFIKEVAEKAGKPFVINMSFGSQIGPHDGTTLYDRTIEDMLGPGALVTAANGNEGGEMIHTKATLNPGEKRYMVVDVSDESRNMFFCFWGNSTDGEKHFKVTPILYVDKAEVEPDATFWGSRYASFDEGVDDYNKKQYFDAKVLGLEEIKKLYASRYPDNPATDLRVALRIEALDTNTQAEGFHIWLEPKYGSVSGNLTFTGQRARMLRGDDEYLVGEGASTIPSAISVASFNSANSWKSLVDGKTYGYNQGAVIGAPSDFSSPGPYLGTANKPLVAAPGSAIVSAYNRYDSDVDFTTSLFITHSADNGTRKDYYGAMQGTSMASPFMAGVVCLWLQANPKLAYKDIEEIVKKTSTREEIKQYTTTYDTTDEWTAKRGYGRVNAYEGLKEALRMATISGIDHVSNSAAPITLLKEADAWKILFNNAERFAHIRIFAADGRLVNSQSLNALTQGQEVVVSFGGLTPGAYLINIATAGSHTTRRVMVK